MILHSHLFFHSIKSYSFSCIWTYPRKTLFWLPVPLPVFQDLQKIKIAQKASTDIHHHAGKVRIGRASSSFLPICIGRTALPLLLFSHITQSGRESANTNRAVFTKPQFQLWWKHTIQSSDTRAVFHCMWTLKPPTQVFFSIWCHCLLYIQYTQL